jgi:hypothetical protein
MESFNEVIFLIFRSKVYATVLPATWEAEAGQSLELRCSRPALATQEDPIKGRKEGR